MISCFLPLFPNVYLSGSRSPLSLKADYSVELKLGVSVENVPTKYLPIIRAFANDWGVPITNRGVPIRFVEDPSYRHEEYKLQRKYGVSIVARDATGFAWGLSTLGLNSLGFNSFGLNSLGSNFQRWGRDVPKFPFRTVLVDVARRYHSISTLKQLVKWCNVGRVRYLQLHLTDDQNWMLPSSVLKGVDSKNRSRKSAYSKAELLELQDFAEDRGVQIIPEIDMPGHSSLLVEFQPEVFGMEGSPSRSCVNFGSDTVRTKLKLLLAEVASLFPHSPYIHLGGDEAWFPDAEKNAGVAERISRLGAGADSHTVFVDFLGEMAEEVIRQKKVPIVWEGFRKSEFAKRRLPKQVVVVAWEGAYYSADELAKDGYPLINAGWDPYYVVNHYPYDAYTLVPISQLLGSNAYRFGTVNWSAQATTVDGKSRTRPTGSEVLFPEATHLLGSMMCWWEGREWNACAYLPERIFAFGESLWPRASALKFNQFHQSFQSIQSRFEQSGFPFAYSVFGTRGGEKGEFLNSAKLVVPHVKGVEFQVITESGRASVRRSPDALVVDVDQDCVISVQAFKEGRECSDKIFLPFYRVKVVDNLALGCPVSSSSDADPQFPLSRITDGVSNRLDAVWMSYPNPQSFTIDLKQSRKINEIQLVSFWAAGGAFRYRVSVKDVNGDWREVVQPIQRENMTSEGYLNRFEPRVVRFVKVEVFGGDIYPSSMSRVNEVRVFFRD